MAINEKFYDVYELRTGNFIMRASDVTVSRIYRWHPQALRRLLVNGAEPTDMFGNGKREDVRMVPVMNDWQADAMPTEAGR